MNQDPPILTVSQFTQAIKFNLESAFPSIWLQGEISNGKCQSSGHFYFSLKDEKAQIGAVMFKTELSALKMIPKDGDKVIVQGEINVYPPTGKYQLIVKTLRQVGLGELLLKLEELKVKLHKKGFFKKEHKKPLPKFPKRIGVVTSPTGAVIQDIIHILTRRYPGFHLILNPVRVQGDGAAQEIAKAIQDFNTHNLVDVMIVGRGGGSLEDLWAFNEEIVAEAIFNSSIPIISAVGHETDHCIADYVADLRAPTPSAAAEIVSQEAVLQQASLQQMLRQLQNASLHLIRKDKMRLQAIIKAPILKSPYAYFNQCVQRLDDLIHEMDNSLKKTFASKKLSLNHYHREMQAFKPSHQIKEAKKKFLYFESSLKKSMERSLSYAQLKLDQINKNLHSINPKNLLSKGYCILFAEKDNSVITSVNNLHVEDSVSALLSDGKVLATVRTIEKSKSSEKK